MKRRTLIAVRAKAPLLTRQFVNGKFPDYACLYARLTRVLSAGHTRLPLTFETRASGHVCRATLET